MAVGRYILDGDLLTMVDSHGKPIRGTNGERVTHKMKAGSMASLLTLKVYRMVRGDGVAGFNRPLVYRPLGIA